MEKDSREPSNVWINEKKRCEELETINAELLKVLKIDVLAVANLAMMTDPELTNEYMTVVYAAIHKAKGDNKKLKIIS